MAELAAKILAGLELFRGRRPRSIRGALQVINVGRDRDEQTINHARESKDAYVEAGPLQRGAIGQHFAP